MRSKLKTQLKKASLSLAAFAVATAIWLPCLLLFFRKPVSDLYQEKRISPKAKQLAARHLQHWTEPTLRRAELEQMRTSNADWDFTRRTFVVWPVDNMGPGEPQGTAQ